MLQGLKHSREAGDLVAKTLGGDDGDILSDALVGREVQRQARVVLLDDDARSLQRKRRGRVNRRQQSMAWVRRRLEASAGKVYDRIQQPPARAYRGTQPEGITRGKMWCAVYFFYFRVCVSQFFAAEKNT